MDGYYIADALEAVFTMLRRANKYIDETTPWVLAKNEANKARLGSVIYNLLETIRIGAALLTPFIPQTAKKIFDMLGTNNESFCFGALGEGTVNGAAEVLFMRIDEEKLLAELEAEKAAKEEAVIPLPEDKCDEIDIGSFMNCELRAAKVIAAEPLPGAKKLLKLQLDLGYERRQVVSGIAEFYKPDDLIGKTVAVVANLKPIVLRGTESYGMILASTDRTGGRVRVVFLDEGTEIGSRIK